MFQTGAVLRHKWARYSLLPVLPSPTLHTLEFVGVLIDRGLSVLGSFPEARDRQLGIGSNLGMLGAVWMDIIVCWE